MRSFTICLALLGICLLSNRVSTQSLNCDCLPNQSNRIVGGQYAEPNEYPWQTSLGMKINDRLVAHLCGATILNAEWVMTAAHCALASKNVSKLSIGFGSNNLRHMKNKNRIDVAEAIVHPKYNPRDSASRGDIALLRLVKPLPLNYKAKPACLHPNASLFNEQIEKNERVSVVATGWGSVKKTYRYLLTSRLRGGQIQPHLKKANFWAIRGNDSNTCKTRDDLLCIDSVISGDSVCNGDSGGPLNYIVSLEEEAEISRSNETAAEESTTTSPEADNLNDIDGPTTIATSAFGPSLTFTSKRDALRRVAVVGVTSFGVGVFSFPNVIRIDFCTGPAAYTRVPYYKDFIEANIDKKNLCYA